MATADLTAAPTLVRPNRPLRTLLMANGIGNAVGGGIPLLFLAGAVASPTGLPSGLLTTVGVFYLIYGAAMWIAGSRPRPRTATITALIAVNPLWAMGCLIILATESTDLTTLGALALGGEAAFVTALATVEWMAYLRSPKSAPSW